MIFNPAAGRTLFRKPQPVEAVANALRRHISEVVLMPTTTDRRAGVLAQAALDRGCDLIAPLGGDGTINEALQAVADSDAALLPLPRGTANVLAHETGLALDPVQVATFLPSLEERSVRLGTVEFSEEGTRRLFLLMCGAGIDANAVYDLNPGMKNRFGMVAYVWSGVRQVFRPLKPMKVRWGGLDSPAGMVVIAKSKLYGGGLTIAPDAHLLADHFDVVCFESTTALHYPWYLVAILTRTMDWAKNISRRQLGTVEVTGSGEGKFPVQMDGELVGSLPIRVEMGLERLRLLAPPEYWARLG